MLKYWPTSYSKYVHFEKGAVIHRRVENEQDFQTTSKKYRGD